MTINGIQIDPDKLMSKADLLSYLRNNGADYHALSDIRDNQHSGFDAEIVWHNPISDGMNLGTFIVPVKEGFISLPYDAVDKHDGELLELGEAAMFDADTMQGLIDDLRSFSDDLISAMTDMQRILSDK